MKISFVRQKTGADGIRIMMRNFKYGTQVIHFKLIREDRKTLGITISPDKQIIVKAPKTKSDEDIYEKLRRKASWISRQIKYFDSLPPSVKERQFVSGETHKYLGKQYRLKVIRSDEKKVCLKGGYIRVLIPDVSDKKRIEILLNKWYRKQADKRFRIYLKECYSIIQKYDVPYPDLYIQKMKTRWGSCSINGRITLNINLIKHSSLSIKYVIMHELCHLKYHNHNKDFYQLLKRVMPDWEKRKYKLDHTEI